MKRKQIFLLFGTIAALLSACTTKNTNDISFSELQIPNTNDTTNNPLTADNVSTYSSIYAQIAADNTSDSVKYALIYLDNDTIPELVVYDAGYDTYSLYTIKDESAFCMLDSFTTVELSYFEQTGIICSFTRWNGGGDEGGYGFSYYQTGSDKTLTDLSEPILSDTYNAVYNDNGEFTGEGNHSLASWALNKVTAKTAWKMHLPKMNFSAISINNSCYFIYNTCYLN